MDISIRNNKAQEIDLNNGLDTIEEKKNPSKLEERTKEILPEHRAESDRIEERN